MSDVQTSVETNADQIEFWNGDAGERWTQNQERLDSTLQPISDQAIAFAAAQTGERVIDIGCGCGTTTLSLAGQVGAGGHALGIDISEPMLARARERAEAAGVSNVAFEKGDAAVRAFEPGTADLLFSRFGVMFFDDPPAAFANLRKAAAPDGRLAFVCWRAVQENPWVFLAIAAARPHLPEMEQPDPHAPGPFAFADKDRVKGILEEGGWSDVAIKPLEASMQLAGPGPDPVSAVVEFQTTVGPLSRLFAEASEAQQEAARKAVAEALEPHAGPGGISLAAGCWLVGARP